MARRISASTTVWVNRAGAPDDNLPGTLAGQIRDLSHLPALLGVS